MTIAFLLCECQFDFFGILYFCPFLSLSMWGGLVPLVGTTAVRPNKHFGGGCLNPKLLQLFHTNH